MTPSDEHGVLVAIRAVDYPGAARSTLDDLDADFAASPGYRGWAIYDYLAASAPSQTQSIPGCELE